MGRGFKLISGWGFKKAKTISGLDIWRKQVRIERDTFAILKNYWFDPATIVASGTSYNFTGTASIPKAGRKVTGNEGAFNWTGISSGLRIDRLLSLANGTYVLTGTNSGLLRGYEVTSDIGSYIFTGTDSAVKIGRQITSDSGAYVLSGTLAQLFYDRIFTASNGAIDWTGSDADLIYIFGYHINAETGEFIETGNPADLVAVRIPYPLEFDFIKEEYLMTLTPTLKVDLKRGKLVEEWV